MAKMDKNKDDESGRTAEIDNFATPAKQKKLTDAPHQQKHTYGFRQ